MFVWGESVALNRFARVVQAFFLDSPRLIGLFKGFHLLPAPFPKGALARWNQVDSWSGNDAQKENCV